MTDLTTDDKILVLTALFLLPRDLVQNQSLSTMIAEEQRSQDIFREEKRRAEHRERIMLAEEQRSKDILREEKRRAEHCEHILHGDAKSDAIYALMMEQLSKHVDAITTEITMRNCTHLLIWLAMV